MSVTIRKLENDLISGVVRVQFQAFDGYMNTRIGRRYVYSPSSNGSRRQATQLPSSPLPRERLPATLSG